MICRRPGDIGAQGHVQVPAETREERRRGHGGVGLDPDEARPAAIAIRGAL